MIIFNSIKNKHSNNHDYEEDFLFILSVVDAVVHDSL